MLKICLCVCVSGTARITSCFVYFDSIVTKTVHIHHCKKDNMHTVNLKSLYPEYFTVLVPPLTDACISPCMMFCKHACYTTKHFFHLSFHHPSRVFCFGRTVK